MSKSYLNIDVNNRRKHVCQLQESFNEDRAFEFLIHREGETEVNLLSVEPDAVFSYTHERQFRQTKIDSVNKSYQISTHDSGKQIELTITLDISEIDQRTPEESNGMKVDLDRGILISFEGAKNNPTETIKMVFKFQNESYISLFHLCSSEPSKMVIDFGSEASQIGYMSGEGKPDRIEIFDEFYDLLEEKEAEDTYYQYDKSKKLFRTNFFVKKNWKDFKPHAKPFDDPNCPVTFICNAAPNDSFAMPNIKLLLNSEESITTEFSDQTSEYIFSSERNITVATKPKITNNFNELKKGLTPISLIHRIIINHFFHICLSKFDTAKYIQFILLVPNIYSQDRVFQIINDFYYDLKQIRKLYPVYEQIKVEFSVIPEGVGPLQYLFINKKDRKFDLDYNKTYLLTDVGKGTTEISIAKTGKTDTKQIRTIYSSGLPAAGNIVNAHWWKELLSTTKKYSIVDPKAKMLTANNVDKEKINGQTGVDDSAYIKCIVKKYAESLVKEIAIAPVGFNDLDKVIFTGRGLLFRPLKEALLEAIKEAIVKKSTQPEEELPKRGFFSRLRKRKVKPEKERFLIHDVIFAEKENDPEFVKKIAVYGPLYDLVLSNKGHDFVLGLVSVMTKDDVHKSRGEGDLLSQGSKVNIKNDDYIKIGRWKYDWPNLSIADEVDGLIFYNGTGFSLSIEGKGLISLILRKEAATHSEWLGASLFPHHTEIKDVGCEKFLDSEDKSDMRVTSAPETPLVNHDKMWPSKKVGGEDDFQGG